MITQKKLVALAAIASMSMLSASAASCAPKASTTAAKVAALAELRDAGVISPEQYQQRAALLQGAGAPRLQAAAALSPFGGARRTHVVQDQLLGLEASRVTTPADWRFEGEAVHGSGCSTPHDTVSYRTESPDGLYGVEVQGGFAYGMSNNPQLNAMAQRSGCIRFGSNAADFLRAVWVPRLRPGAQIEEVGPIPDDDPIMQQARQMAARIALPPQNAGFQARMFVSGGRVKLRYAKKGAQVEESIQTIALCSQTRAQTMMGPAQEVLDCTAAPLVVTRAPEGKLAAFLVQQHRVVDEADDSAYRQKLNQLITRRGAAEGAQIAANGQAALAQTATDNRDRLNDIMSRNNAAIDNIHRIGGASMAAARASEDARHASAQGTARSMGDQAQFTDPYGRTFLGSNQYSHTYVDRNGRVIQTNSAYPPGPDWIETTGR